MLQEGWVDKRFVALEDLAFRMYSPSKLARIWNSPQKQINMSLYPDYILSA